MCHECQKVNQLEHFHHALLQVMHVTHENISFYFFFVFFNHGQEVRVVNCGEVLRDLDSRDARSRSPRK